MRAFTLHLRGGAGYSAKIRFDPVFTRWQSKNVELISKEQTTPKDMEQVQYLYFQNNSPNWILSNPLFLSAMPEDIVNKNPWTINKYVTVFIEICCQNLSFSGEQMSAWICIHTKHVDFILKYEQEKTIAM